MRVIAVGLVCCCFLLVGLVAQEITLVTAPAPREDGWKDLDEFLSSGLTYDSAGNVVLRNLAGQGRWRVKHFGDVLGGKSGIVFSVHNTAAVTALLKIRCSDGKKVDVIVSIGSDVENLPGNEHEIPEGVSLRTNSQQFASYYQRVVRTKFDRSKPQLEQWNVGQKTGDMFAIGAKKHLEEILKATVLYFQFKPYGQSETTLEFPVVGLGTYQTELKTDCGVDLPLGDR